MTRKPTARLTGKEFRCPVCQVELDRNEVDAHELVRHQGHNVVRPTDNADGMR